MDGEARSLFAPVDYAITDPSLCQWRLPRHYRIVPLALFLARFAARFSIMVLAGSFRACFFLSRPLLIAFAPFENSWSRRSERHEHCIRSGDTTNHSVLAAGC
jgi:hypothetical protein